MIEQIIKIIDKEIEIAHLKKQSAKTSDKKQFYTGQSSILNALKKELRSINSVNYAYLVDIDNEATVVIADNIASAMDKAASASKQDYRMVYSKSIPVL